MPNQTAADLFLDEVKDLYDAEKQLLRTLPRLAKAVSNEELSTAFREHVEQTRGQIGRLEQIFEMLGQRAKSKPCKAMKGMVEEAQELISEGSAETVLDCAMTGAARKVEHYEMAGYLSAQDMAKGLGMKEAVKLLAQTLEEEKEMHRRLKQLSPQLIKIAKVEMESSGEEEESQPARGRKQGRSSAPASRSNGGNGRAGRKPGASRGGGKNSGELTNVTTDHEEIRQWAESRGAHPACVKGTGKRGGTGMIRLDFPGFSGQNSLQEITWDEFFEQFDNNELALIYQDKTAGGKQSNFNKLVRRED
jgi:ferritin-like metal-binding protein YciE